MAWLIPIVQWTACVALSGLSLCFILTNFAMIGAFGRKHCGSLIPFAGGLVGSIGCGLCPADAVRSYAWLPLLIDPGTAFLLVAVIVCLPIHFVRSRLTKDGGDGPQS